MEQEYKIIKVTKPKYSIFEKEHVRKKDFFTYCGEEYKGKETIETFRNSKEFREYLADLSDKECRERFCPKCIGNSLYSNISIKARSF